MDKLQHIFIYTKHKFQTDVGVFFFCAEREGCKVLVLHLLLDREGAMVGLLAGMFMFLTLSRMIWRIVFRNALRNSDVLWREMPKIMQIEG